MSAPYKDLTPDVILDALDTVGLRGDGRFIALNSYENRVYQIYLEEGAPVVAKFYRPGRWTDAAIDEEHRFALLLAEREIPVVAPLAFAGRTLAEHKGYRFAVYPRRGGRAPELDDPKVLEWIGRFIGRMHAVGAIEPFRERPAIDIATFAEEPRAFLLENNLLSPDLRPAYETIVALAIEAIRAAFDAVGDIARIRLHGDCHAGNILWTDAGPHFVDLDDARMGPAVQDLWMLLSGDRAQMTEQLGKLVDGYEQFHEFDPRELRLLEALRTLRLIHYAAWLARRWDDPAFPAAFPWFGGQKYWQDHILALREQVAAMAEPPLAV